MNPPLIRVEFFGVPRQRAGVPETTLEVASPGATLGDALGALALQFPQLAPECLSPDGQLQSGYAVNLDGNRFVRDPATPLAGVQTLLLLSADPGG